MAAVFVFVAIITLAVARPVTASNRYWGTGANVRISLIDRCGTRDDPATFTYPANTPFFIQRGWAEQPWKSDSPANKAAFMGPATYFEFRLDFVPQPSTLFATNVPPADLQLKQFISEYDRGLTGTHRFGGLWYVDGAHVGGTPGEAVFTGGCVVNVTFA